MTWRRYARRIFLSLLAVSFMVVLASQSVAAAPTPDVDRLATALALKTLAVDVGQLKPVFTGSGIFYSVLVPSTTTQIRVTAVPNDPAVKLTVNKVALSADGHSQAIAIKPGTTWVFITLTDGTLTRMYGIQVVRLTH